MVSLYDDPAEPAKKKDKKPKETPATGNNTVNAAKKKKKRDTSKVTYFNYNKKGYYASNCTKPKY